MAADATNAQLTELGAALLSRGDELSDTTVALMRRDVSFHRTVALVSDDQLRATVRTHLDVILGAFGSAEHGYNTSAAAATGRSRAAASVPLPAVMDSYRICVRFPWDELQAEASRVSAAARCDVSARLVSDVDGPGRVHHRDGQRISGGNDSSAGQPAAGALGDGAGADRRPAHRHRGLMEYR